MSLTFNQTQVSLKILKEKTESIILGEILHYSFQLLLIYEREIFNLSPDSKELKEKLNFYIQKALTFYPEPLPQRKKLFKEAFEILYQLFREQEKLKEFKNIIENAEQILKEPEGFFKDGNDFCDVRPDLIVKKPREWIILEFKLHKGKDEEQIRKYISFLKKIFPNDNIKLYLISLDPFNIELKYQQQAMPDESSYSYPTQLKLFKNLS